MKKIILYILPFATIVILLTAFSGNIAHYPNGAPAGYTGSPGDGQNCTACHNGTASTVQNWITSNVDQTGYLPGQTYTITVTVTGTETRVLKYLHRIRPVIFMEHLLLAQAANLQAVIPNYITHSSYQQLES